ncbi:MAG: exopolyphosphatase [Flavobacteriaceae bacterium]|nr:exopolyphosphatase [Flavobacteriaceae bacterium]
MKIQKYAAIDIGSNAIRLLIANIISVPNKATQFKKASLVRVPIRLGSDVFSKGKISKESETRMVKALNAFKLLMEVNNVENYKACATSAMREARNGQAVADAIFAKTTIKIDIIDGKTEALIISSTDLHDYIDENKSYLYVDVGGGSTEFNIYKKGKITHSKSFLIGTVRLLDKKVSKQDWKAAEEWIKEYTQELHKLSLIGSGGNINKIHKMSGRKPEIALSYIFLNAQYRFLKTLSYEERISELNLNPDRADVIIPALKIYLSAMKWSGARNIYVPKIGLSDGIIKSLYSGKLT